jgi:multidrug transporter EmrE-like cation transporter
VRRQFSSTGAATTHVHFSLRLNASLPRGLKSAQKSVNQGSNRELFAGSGTVMIHSAARLWFQGHLHLTAFVTVNAHVALMRRNTVHCAAYRAGCP